MEYSKKTKTEEEIEEEVDSKYFTKKDVDKCSIRHKNDLELEY